MAIKQALPPLFDHRTQGNRLACMRKLIDETGKKPVKRDAINSPLVNQRVNEGHGRGNVTFQEVELGT